MKSSNRNNYVRGVFALATLAIAITALVFMTVTADAAGFFGAVYTTLGDGTAVDHNIYASKDAVYLNGGPQNDHSNGLPDGTYYFQVTDPSGKALLSSDPAACRQVLVVGGRIAGAIGPCPHANGTPDPTNGSTAVQLIPYDDTPNAGGEYKVWLIAQTANTTVGEDGVTINFRSSDSKTDNFKVNVPGPTPTPTPCQPGDPQCNQPPPVVISGIKFRDSNMSGAYDNGEDKLEGWRINLYKVTLDNSTTPPTEVETLIDLRITDDDGAFSFTVPFEEGVKYRLEEEQQDSWFEVTPNPNKIDVVLANDGQGNPIVTYANNNFGNIHLSTIGGVKYYDSNNNGVIDGGDATLSGITIHISVTLPNAAHTVITEDVVTGTGGVWTSSPYPDGSTFTAAEVLPTPDGTNDKWVQIYPAGNGPQSGTVGDTSSFNFLNIHLGRLSGIKYYDSDNSGGYSAGDVGLAGIKIVVTINGVAQPAIFTGAGGVWTSPYYPYGSTFSVAEFLPPSGPAGSWTQLSGGGSGTIGSGSGATSYNFVNVCRRTPGGHTLGFWSNNNGQALETSGDFLALTNFNLRNANGSARDFTGTLSQNKSAYNSWVLGASATNMAYMLSAQMSATYLSTVHGFTDGTVLVDGTNSVSAEISYANGLLANPIVGGVFNGQNGSVTVNASALRTEQTRVKDIFDKVNNGGSFIQALPCQIVY